MGDIGDAKRTPTHNLQYTLSKKQVSMCDAKTEVKLNQFILLLMCPI